MALTNIQISLKDMEAIYQEFVKRGPAGAIHEEVYLSLGYTVQTGSAAAPIWHASVASLRSAMSAANRNAVI
jgi:hypothetical protein